MQNKLYAVIGPTASGKTKKAIEIAARVDGEVVNYDSLQVYEGLPILTAYPTEDELAAVPHKLFGFVVWNQNITVFDWAKRAAREIQDIWERGKIPILVGGTGFYLGTLINGVSPLPEIPVEIRSMANELAAENYKLMCEEVYRGDERIGDYILPANHHQMKRAWEVYKTSGRSILYFYGLPKLQFLNARVDITYILSQIERDELYKRIDLRFDQMIQNGAIHEVEVLFNRAGGGEYEDLVTQYHIFRAIGAREIISYFQGKLTKSEMIAAAKQSSRNYAKRQMTWFRRYV